MIPLWAHVHFRNRRGSRFLIGIPLILVWLLLLPVILLILPVFFLACIIGRVDAFDAIAIIWEILTSLNGTQIQIGTTSIRLA